MSNPSIQDGPERIAVVGMACRFPGADGVDAFWRNLRDGVESIARFSEAELAAAGVAPELLRRPEYVPAFGRLEGADLFDPDFFELTARDAELMDPQQRLFLEQAWAALEHAGLDPDTFPGAVGVFAGTNMNTYLLSIVARQGMRGADLLLNRIRSDKDFLATLASYKLDLRGPSLTVQTACSTSLVAVHLACQSLLDFQCDAALAGGVSVSVPLVGGYLAREGVFSPDGRCRPFDEAGEGTVGGSGVGVVVLKRLRDALADGDRVHAVILGSAVNNDGAGKVGYTAPGVEGQIEVVATAQGVAEVDPATITYVEAHGTATPLGDPIEVDALSRAFDTDARGFCALGSVKSNVGHLDAAAGVASLIKTVLALEHGEIPPTLHFRRPNPRIDFAASPFFVADRLLPWAAPAGVPRRAGVSSFGVGGTNAHLVLEEAPPAPRPAAPAPRHEALVLSARTPEALDRLAAALAGRLEAHPAPELRDVAFTLQRGRRAFPWRRALAAADAAEAARLLRGGDPARVATAAAAGSDPGAVFLFSGLGTQYAGMGAGLYRDEPAFRAAMDRCFALLRDRHGVELRPVLYPEGAEAPAAPAAAAGPDLRALLRGPAPDTGDPLRSARLGHAATFATGYALAELWRSRGVEPRAVAGHSLGEYVAACVAGVFTLEDALALVVRRAELVEPFAGGAMAAVGLPEEETRARVEEARAAGHAVWLGAVNAPASCVVSGSAEGVAAVAERAAAAGAAVRPLAVRHPFHSGLLEPVRAELARLVAGFRLGAPAVPLASDVTGGWLRPEQARSPEYWAEHLVSPVRFADCVATLRGLGGSAGEEPVLVELGPGPVLAAWARQAGAARTAAALRHGEQPGPDHAHLQRALGQAWCWGVRVEWEEHPGARRVPLPGHPLDRRRFWLADDPPAPGERREPRGAEAGARRPLERWFYAPSWRRVAEPAPAPGALAGAVVVAFGGTDALLERLRGRGVEAVRVRPGAEFRDAGGEAVLRPEAAEDYARLAARLAGRGPVHTLHLWSLDDAAEDAGPDQVRAGLAAGFGSALRWVQALGGEGMLERDAALLAATRGAREVLGTEALRPWQAPLAGLLRVVGQEHPRTRVRTVDLDAGPGWEAAVLRELEELAAGGAGDLPETAWRGRRRWEPVFAERPLDASPAAEGGVRVRAGGAYLVTGGLGGIGLALAERLVREGARRLVLVGRRGLPPRGEWDAHGGGDDATGRRIRAVRALEAQGAEVWVAAADVADEDALRRVAAEARARFGPLHGAVHAAGVVPGGLVQLRTPEQFAGVMAPKVLGTVALDRALAGEPLDFFVLCSSLHALYGGIGSADHCAANAFLDAYAAWRTERTGRPTVSIGWDGWSEVGQAAEMAVSRRLGDLLRGARPLAHPLLRTVAERAGGWDFEGVLGPDTHWVLAEHRVGGTALLPGTAYLEMARAAFAERAPGAAPSLEQVVFLAPLAVPDGAARRVRLRLEPRGGGFDFRVWSAPDGADGAGETEHARGRVGPASDAPAPPLELDAVRARLAPVDLPGAEAHAGPAALGFGPRWTGLLRTAARGEGELLAGLELPEAFRGDLADLPLHPALLDAATGFLRALGGGLYLPLAYERVRVDGPLPARLWSHVRFDPEAAGADTLTCDVALVDGEGRERVRVGGYTLRRVPDPAALAAPPAAPAEPAARPLLDPAAGIAPAEGAEALLRILAHGAGPQVAVCTRDLPALVERARRFTREEMVEAIRERQEAGPSHPRPPLSTPFQAPRGGLEEELAAIFSRALGVEPVGAHDGFFELGGDSLLATQLLRTLGDAFGVELPLRVLFESPTPAQLALAVVARQVEALDDDLLDRELAAL